MPFYLIDYFYPALYTYVITRRPYILPIIIWSFSRAYKGGFKRSTHVFGVNFNVFYNN